MRCRRTPTDDARAHHAGRFTLDRPGSRHSSRLFPDQAPWRPVRTSPLVASGIEDTLPPLRLISAAPALPPPVRPRVDPVSAPRLSYADFLERQNVIERRIDNPAIPYSDYLRSLPARAPAAREAPTSRGSDDSDRRDRCPACAPTLGPKLADVPPPQAVRREIEVRTTYRVEVPLTSGRLIDVVM